MNIMSSKLKIFGEITWSLSLEISFNKFNNAVFSSCRKRSMELVHPVHKPVAQVTNL